PGGGGDTTLASQPSGDMRESSQPPPPESAPLSGRHHPPRVTLSAGMNLERLAPRIQHASRRRSLPSKLGGALRSRERYPRSVKGSRIPIAPTRRIRDNRHDPSGVVSAQSAGCRQGGTGRHT